VSRLLRRLIGEDVELSVRPDPAAGAVRVDPGQIEQALINLAVNARDAMPGGGKLTVTVGRRRVREEEGDADVDLPAGDYATIEFRDTGTGISEEARRHLFEPFFTTKGPGRGTGLGLATAYGIVRQHGGTLVADPPAAGGAVFRMFLPAAAGEERPAPETPDRGEVRRGGETVLVVEDDRSVRRLEVLILRGLGYRVLEASGPEEALRLSRETDGAIDVLASDLVMPRMGGLELAEKIRAERPGIRVLLVSGYGEETVDGGRTRTARQRFLEKPFTEQTLGGALRELLDER
jgi:CheY-like chemotaxis protein